MNLNFILKEKKIREKLLKENLKKILKDLRKLGANKVYLFGSLLKNNIDFYSDIDLFVIMPSTKSGKDWSKIIYEEIEKSVAVDFIVFNEKEFQEEKEINPFIKDIIENGKLIYSKK